MRGSRFLLPAGLGAAVVLALLAWSLWPSSDAREYVTAPVERGAIVSTVTATGTVNPVKSVQVGTYVSGPILEIFADFNSPVKRGQRIAKIDPRSFVGKVEISRAALANAVAQVSRARADATLKEQQVERQRALARTRILSANDLDVAEAAALQARAELEVAEASVEQAKAALREAEVNLGYTDIVSPVDGIIVSRNVDVGQTVAASFQTPTLFVIAEDLSRMQVNAFVSEADVGRVHDDQEATFTVDAFPGRPFPATVRQVRNSPTTVQNVVTYDVVLDVDNRDGLLKPGMTASVRIVTARTDDALVLPTAALRFRPPEPSGGDPATGASAAPPTSGTPGVRPSPGGTERGATVYRLERGQPVAVNVVPGLSDETLTEIESPALAPGDRVILRVKSPAPPPSTSLPGMGRR